VLFAINSVVLAVDMLPEFWYNNMRLNLRRRK
jgi:hypothetical protein